MKKDLLQTVTEDLRKRGNKNYNLIYELLLLAPCIRAEMPIRLDENNKLFINEDLIGNLDDITFVKQNDNSDNEIIELEFEDLDINYGVTYRTRKLVFKWSRENSWDNYTLEDWFENPTYKEEVETEMAKQQFENTPFEDGDVPL